MAKYYVEANTNGTHWYKDPEMKIHHREDGPAIEWANGNKEWYKDGKFDRVGGPAIELTDGTKSWYKDGERHRDDGPAAIGADGYKAWWINGDLHREDGPAVEYPNGNIQYWLKGNRLTADQWNDAITPKELTVAEIEQLLGMRIKVVDKKSNQ